MAFSKGRFGVLYHRRNSEEKHLLRWLVVVVLLVLVAFVCYKVSKRLKQAEETTEPPPLPYKKGEAADAPARRAPEPPAPRRESAGDRPAAPTAEKAPPAPAVAVAARPKPTPAGTKAAPELPSAARAMIAKIRETIADRPSTEQILLRKLVDAEEQGKTIIAADTIQKLVRRPAVGDLSDLLLRRLGDLNLQRLFSGTPTPWTTTVTVRKGDGRERIAREYRTTPAAVARLNPDVKWERLRPGDTLRVLNFPSATLVVHKNGYADLSLNRNESFFRRYYLSVSPSAKSGIYPIESGSSAVSRFRELGMKLAAPDRAELEMFLPQGSRIVVYQEQ